MDTPETPYKQPYIPAIAAALGAIPKQPVWSSHEDVRKARVVTLQMMAADTARILNDKDINVENRTILGPGGEILISILSSKKPRSSEGLRPGILHTHAGGMLVGDRFTGLALFTSFIKDLDAVIVTPEYRLAPEHTGTALVDDCYASLCWFADNLSKLNVDPAKLLIAGGSAGGGLAAGTALMARDRNGPKLCGQMLICPMLDHRCITTSNKQYFIENGTWGGAENKYAWSCLLGEQVDDAAVSHYVSPSTATDLSRLPPTFIDVGGAEPFRDEAIKYALDLSAAGVLTDLHVWGGGCHGFEMMAPDDPMSKSAVQAKLDWGNRILSS